MPACEKCWRDAGNRAASDPSKSKTEHYYDLLEERKDSPCSSTPDEITTLRARVKELEAIFEAGRHAFDDINQNGKTILDLMNVWLDKKDDANTALRERVRELEEKVLATVRGQFTQICSYCGWEAPPPNGWEELQEHIKQCPKHPLVQALQDNARLQAELAAAREAYQSLKKAAIRVRNVGGCQDNCHKSRCDKCSVTIANEAFERALKAGAGEVKSGS